MTWEIWVRAHNATWTNLARKFERLMRDEEVVMENYLFEHAGIRPWVRPWELDIERTNR